jgi:hypothetical protein
MPLPSDDRIIQLANDLFTQFDEIFGLHPGFRPAHAKGIMLSGAFTPSPDSYSRAAPHARFYSCNPEILQLDRFSFDSRQRSRFESSRTRDPFPPRRSCSHRHREPFDGRLSDQNWPGVPRFAASRGSWRSVDVSCYASGRASLRANTQAKSHKLCKGTLFRRDSLPIYQPARARALRPVSDCT